MMILLFVVFLIYRYQVFIFLCVERVGQIILMVKWISSQILWDQSESDFILKNAERKNIDKQNSDKGKHSIQREFNAEKKYKH